MSDNLTPEQRSYCMSRVKSKDTSLEKIVRSELHKRGLRFNKHVKHLPGKPDVVFPGQHVAVFIDGDFWHGYRLSSWGASLSPAWREKIEQTRKRDLRNFAKLRRNGWIVIRLWEHEIKKDLSVSVNKIINCISLVRKRQLER